MLDVVLACLCYVVLQQLTFTCNLSGHCYFANTVYFHVCTSRLIIMEIRGCPRVELVLI